MPEPSSSASGKAGAPKKPVSPIRNIIGIVVLIAVCVAGWFQYSALAGYNAAVNALELRSNDENKDLMTESEAEKLLNKEPDDAGSDVREGNANYTKKTYTWKGLKSYTVTAYYIKGKTPALHHFETSEKKYEAEVPQKNAPPGGGQALKKEPLGNLERPKAKADEKKPDEKKPDEKKADEKKPDEKKADEKKPDEKKADEKKPDEKESKTPAKGS